MNDTYNGGVLYSKEKFILFLDKEWVNPERGNAFWHDGYGESNKMVMFNVNSDGKYTVVDEGGWSHIAWYPRKDITD